MTSEEEIVIDGPPESPQIQNTNNEDNIEVENNDDIEEANSTCTICMEEWTLGSGHRVCCLKCGHLFGRSCIERWIKEKGSNAKCPSCNKTAKKLDLRDLWCKAIRAIDDTEFHNIQKLLDAEKKLRQTDSAIIFQQNMKLEMLSGDLDKLKRDLKAKDEKIRRLETMLDKFHQFRAQCLASGSVNPEIDTFDEQVTEYVSSRTEYSVPVEPQELKGSFHLVETIEQANIRCSSFTSCPIASLLLVSQAAPQNARSIFGDFGVRKFSTLDTSVSEFIPLHAKMITSIGLKPIGDLFLTSSLDKRVKLTSVNNNTCVQSYQCQFDPTTVSWSSHRDQQFYVGSGNCHVTLFDIRNTSEYIYQKKVASNTRLMSVASTTGTDDLNGLLVNDSKGSQFLEVSPSSSYDMESIDRSAEHLTNHVLPFDGVMGTVDFYKPLELSLVTTRRNPRFQRMTHTLFRVEKLTTEAGEIRVSPQDAHTFHGGSPSELLGHSRILRHPTLHKESVLVCSCDSEARGIKLWDSSDKSEYQSIRTDRFIRDVVLDTPENTNQSMLYALFDYGFKVYRWEYA